MAKKKAEHYVNNKEFLKALIEFREVLDKAEKEEKPRPQVPIYIAECYMKIGTHLATKPNFYNYTFREDMIMDGVENCLQYMDNFNPEKYDNPFAYFTQIIFFAFFMESYVYCLANFSDSLTVLCFASEKIMAEE